MQVFPHYALAHEDALNVEKYFKVPCKKRYHEIRVHGGLTTRICPICQGVYDSDEALDLYHATIHGNPQEVDDLISNIYGRFSPFL